MNYLIEQLKFLKIFFAKFMYFGFILRLKKKEEEQAFFFV